MSRNSRIKVILYQEDDLDQDRMFLTADERLIYYIK